jgi:hypothetical protein
MGVLGTSPVKNFPKFACTAFSEVRARCLALIDDERREGFA